MKGGRPKGGKKKEKRVSPLVQDPLLLNCGAATAEGDRCKIAKASESCGCLAVGCCWGGPTNQSQDARMVWVRRDLAASREPA